MPVIRRSANWAPCMFFPIQRCPTQCGEYHRLIIQFSEESIRSPCSWFRVTRKYDELLRKVRRRQFQDLTKSKVEIASKPTIFEASRRDRATTGRSTAMVLMLFACHCAEANSNFSSSLLCNHNRPQSLCQVDCAMFAENYFNGRATAIKRCGLLRLSGGRVGLRERPSSRFHLLSSFPPQQQPPCASRPPAVTTTQLHTQIRRDRYPGWCDL